MYDFVLGKDRLGQSNDLTAVGDAIRVELYGATLVDRVTRLRRDDRVTPCIELVLDVAGEDANHTRRDIDVAVPEPDGPRELAIQKMDLSLKRDVLEVHIVEHDGLVLAEVDGVSVGVLAEVLDVAAE